jgi:hypothetical protein
VARTFEGDFEHLLKAIREWAEIGKPMPAKNANEKLSWLFQQYGILPDTPAGREQQLTGSVFVIPKSIIPEIHEITSWVGEPATHARCAGVLATACTQGKRTQHGRPQGVVKG